MRIALVAMPWRSLLIPALRPAALKAWLTRHGIAAVAHHLYLDVAAAFGASDYEALAERMLHQDLAQEASYAALLYPDRREAAGNVARHSGVSGLDDGFWSRWAAAHDAAFGAVAWGDYDLVVICGDGVVSAPESHYLAGIEAARRIKAAAPQARTVLVGPDFAGAIGQSLLSVFPWVDHVINGEPETPLLALAQADPRIPSSPIAGLLSRADDGSVAVTLSKQLPDLDGLPVPDYDEFWHHPVLEGFSPLLRLEGARGCWWDRSHKDPRLSCQFCNINVEWRGYRAKSIPAIVADLTTLSDRYGCDRFSFLDKVHRPHDMAALFDAIAATGRPWAFYAVECHLALPSEALPSMKRAGVQSVQFGVEALTDNLLQQMNKGAGVAKIIELMRVCTELEIATVANLIVDYPQATADDVTETLARLDWFRGLLPLQHSVLNLGYGSPLTMPGTALPGLRNAPAYKAFLPGDVVDRLQLMLKAADRPARHVDWSPVTRYLQDWQEGYRERPWAFRREWHDTGHGQVVAVWYDSQERPTARNVPPLAARVLDLCRTPRSESALDDALADVPTDERQRSLAQLAQMGLIVLADGLWVTLALQPPGGLQERPAAREP